MQGIPVFMEMSFRMNMRNLLQEVCFSFEILHFVYTTFRMTCVLREILPPYGRRNDSVLKTVALCHSELRRVGQV